LNYTGKGRYGFDDITLGYIGSGGLAVKNQSIAGIATKSYFMGLFGLTPRSQNFTSFNDPIPSFMQSLQNEAQIPSLSWSYTAGNQYRMFFLLILNQFQTLLIVAAYLTALNQDLKTCSEVLFWVDMIHHDL
jgi:hypothetical protein